MTLNERADAQAVEAAVQDWLQRVVVGVNLCPFAARPLQRGQVRFCVTEADDKRLLLGDLQAELERMDQTPANELETTLVIIPRLLGNFLDFNEFLDWVDRLLDDGNWEGVYQVASFHPHYQFAGTHPADAENLTNRAPYPILHILREASVEQALDAYDDAAQIPERNIRRMNELTEAEKQALFPYLFSPAAGT